MQIKFFDTSFRASASNVTSLMSSLSHHSMSEIGNRLNVFNKWKIKSSGNQTSSRPIYKICDTYIILLTIGACFNFVFVFIYYRI